MAKPRRRGRRILAAALVVAALLAAGAFFVQRALDAERYRDLAEKAILDATGIEAHIGHLHAAWLPLPHLRAEGLRLITPEASATASFVDIEFNLSHLLYRALEISSIDIAGLQVQLPETQRSCEDLRARVQHALDSYRPDKDSTWTVALGFIRARDLRLFHGRDEAARADATVRPDFVRSTWCVEGHGDADLARLPRTTIDAFRPVNKLRGRAVLTRLAGTFTAQGGVPEDLIVQGELRNAAIAYADGDVTVDLAEMNGKFISEAKKVQTTLTALGAHGAAVSVKGAYDLHARTWQGVLDTDVAAFAPPLFAGAPYERHVVAAANALGPSSIEVRAEAPSSAHKNWAIDAKRRGDVAHPATARIEFGDRVKSIAVNATLPVGLAVQEYFSQVEGSGLARVEFNYDGAGHRYNVAVDATNCAISSATILNKPLGTRVEVKISGAAGDEWTLGSIEARVQGEPALSAAGPVKDGALPFQVQLRALVALLPEGASADGVVRGALRLDPLAGNVSLEDAAFALNKDVALDHLRGGIAFTADTLSCEHLEVHGARSDCTFAVKREAGRWSGHATGNKLDVDAVVDLVEAARAYKPPARARQAAQTKAFSLWDAPFIGEFAADLAEVYYRRGHLDAVRFRVLGEERALRVRDFTARGPTGTLIGSCDVLPGESVDAEFKAALKWSGFDGRVLNDMAFVEDRRFSGVFDGEMTFAAPFDVPKQMMAAGNGSAHWKARDGSLGTVGFASKLLSVLKTTEVINLKAPTLRDKGITYTTCTGGVNMQAGVMRLDDVKLDGGAYAMTAKGSVDFAQEKTDVTVDTQVLESVGKILGKVPLLGGIAKAVSTDLIVVPVQFAGSPYDLKVEMAKATGKTVVTTPLRAGEGVVKAVGKSLKKLIPGGKNKKEKEAEPPQ